MDKFAINFFIVGQVQQFAYRALTQVPSIGQRCVFKEKRYNVVMVEWCLDEDATNSSRQARINIELEPV
ncbi:hypothetical protein OHW75_01685 [Acinetobacter baumannii]|uniref:hypothetical protein n=1 Tax=Acinetobacter baumannii TaxID=470 RepID=UPI000DE5F046|nr:hypothetical protein [Acinetobacter baumannii]MDC5352061.1 hypothetical protein [Acinetobacter baumannii]MDC5399634.1 hypothetical protein [Acinetobacter baumannii]MDH2620900.1 hypothetical protein [Acinetobacter baumannii]UZG63071.1 hypothetical protein OMP06_04600 [Acinetobacter baumannii]SSR27975.1 Uncharacterised protein [Acinetobacter baumannii]